MARRKKVWRKMTDDQIESVDWILRVIDCSPAVTGRAREVIHFLHAELRDECSRRSRQRRKASDVHPSDCICHNCPPR